MSKKTEHKLLHDFGPYYKTARSVLEALDDVKEEFVNSNYHTHQIERAQSIIKAWAQQNDVALGMSTAQRTALSRLQHKNWMRNFKKKYGDIANKD